LSSSRGIARRICGSDIAARCAKRRALSGLSSQRAAQAAGSISRIFAVSTLGDRKLLEMKRPMAPPIRSLLCGTIAVCGIGMPSGWRNKATTANQSAQAPIIPASAKARR
jgi:hypothetical protein